METPKREQVIGVAVCCLFSAVAQLFIDITVNALPFTLPDGNMNAAKGDDCFPYLLYFHGCGFVVITRGAGSIVMIDEIKIHAEIHSS
jgi:hypothetical protein